MDGYDTLGTIILIMMALSALGLYLIVYSAVLWSTTQWKKRTRYQKGVSVVGAGLFLGLFLAICAAAYSSMEPIRTVVPGTYYFKKFDVSVAYPSTFTPTEYDTEGAEGDRNEIIAFVDSDGHYALVVAVSNLITVEMEKHASEIIYGAPTSQIQKTINGKTFDVASYTQTGEFPSRDIYYLQENKISVEAIFNHDPDYDEETVTSFREALEQMLGTLRVNEN
jgi:hypothetical protein